MAGLQRLIKNYDRRAWEDANERLTEKVQSLSRGNRALVTNDQDVRDKLSTHKDDPRNNELFADYVAALDFSLMKHMDAKPFTFRLLS